MTVPQEERQEHPEVVYWQGKYKDEEWSHIMTRVVVVIASLALAVASGMIAILGADADDYGMWRVATAPYWILGLDGLGFLAIALYACFAEPINFWFRERRR